MENIQVYEWCAHFIRQQVKEGDTCIDATMGNGNDTLLLSKLCGRTGKVWAFDIQSDALDNTRAKLLKAQAPLNYELLQKSHIFMEKYAAKDSASCIVFNFGYLPGGDHSCSTRKESSIPALEQSLTLLKKGGLLSLCIYSGGDTGFEEKNAILDWLKTLNPRKYLVIKSEYYNRPNNPPVSVQVVKL